MLAYLYIYLSEVLCTTLAYSNIDDSLKTPLCCCNDCLCFYRAYGMEVLLPPNRSIAPLP